MHPDKISEILAVFGIISAMCFVFIAIISFGLSFFVGLKEPPARRAYWTAGASYLAAVLFGLFGGPAGWEWGWPLAGLPGAAVVFLYWRYEFRKAWYDDPSAMPEGVNLIDDDWRSGLIKLAAILIAATVSAAIRNLFRH